MRHTRRSVAASVATLVLLVGCGSGGSSTDGSTAQADSKPTDGAAADEPSDQIDEGQEPGGQEPEDQEPDAQSDLASGTADPGAGGAGGTPQDITLDLTDRHVGGTVLQVSGLRFEGNTMLLDAEFINGSTGEVELYVADTGQRLRLIDDLGNTYNFVVPDGESDRLTLPVGESVGGAFAFLGPVDPAATELTVAVNRYDPIEDYDPSVDTYAGTSWPTFVLSGIELVR